MVDSDKSDNGESHMTEKRVREDNSEDEKFELPSKRPRSKSPEPPGSVGVKKEIHVQATNGSMLSLQERTDLNKIDNKLKNGKVGTDDSKIVQQVKESKEEENSDKEETLIKKKNVDEEDENIELKLKDGSHNQSNDSEVVDGLELSVECASDKEASSSESEKEKDSQPRPKTIIVKAKPNDSELEVGSSEAEKLELDEEVEEDDVKNKKRKRKRKLSAKVSSSHSEESLESNSDEDYSPKSEKTLKAVTPKKTPQKTKTKKEQGNKKKHITDSENDTSESDNEDMSLAKRAKKASIENTKKTIDADKSDSESESKTESSEDSHDTNLKNGKRKSISRNPMDNKKIKNLRRYLATAGIRVVYEKLWAGCKTNVERIDRMKKLLEENGLQGKPTLEKCKKLKIKNATKKEVAELDTSHIISEGRITRARTIKAKKESMGTPTKEREARNVFKRIQPICDSDTE